MTSASASCNIQTAEEISSITRDKNSIWKLALGQCWHRLLLTSFGVINNSIQSHASSWRSSNNPYPCLLQPLTNEFSCHLSCHREGGKNKKIWKTVVWPGFDLKGTFSEKQPTEVTVLSFVFVFLFMLIPLCLVFFFPFFFRPLLIFKGMQIYPNPVLKSRRHCPPYITTQI